MVIKKASNWCFKYSGFFGKKQALGVEMKLYFYFLPLSAKKKPIRDEPVLALHKTIIYTTFLIAGFSNK